MLDFQANQSFVSTRLLLCESLQEETVNMKSANYSQVSLSLQGTIEA